MDESIRIRELKIGEVEKAHRLVKSVFDEFVAPLFTEEGVSQFKSFIEPNNLKQRLQERSFILVAEIGKNVVGVLAMRDWSHIFLLFVDGKLQRRGIAKKLLEKALKRCEHEDHLPAKVTVNSSPNAVAAYQRMGFVQIAEEEIHQGIRAIPMELEIDQG
jgi:GNAT superfamily N-acetyltransferase